MLGMLASAAALAALPATRARTQTKAVAPVSGETKLLDQGQRLFRDYCAICHFSNSTAKKIGPGLKGFYYRGEFANGKKVDDESLRNCIKNGSKDMPGFAKRLKDDEVRALIAYMKTL